MVNCRVLLRYCIKFACIEGDVVQSGECCEANIERTRVRRYGQTIMEDTLDRYILNMIQYCWQIGHMH